VHPREQNLLLTAYRKSYEKSIGTKMNDLDLFSGRIGHVNYRVTFNVEYVRNR